MQGCYALKTNNSLIHLEQVRRKIEKDHKNIADTIVQAKQDYNERQLHRIQHASAMIVRKKTLKSDKSINNKFNTNSSTNILSSFGKSADKDSSVKPSKFKEKESLKVKLPSLNPKTLKNTIKYE